VFPKGNVAKVTSLETKLPQLPGSICRQIVVAIESALVERFSALPKLGKVYIDPALKDVLVPFSQRSASKTLRTLVRGSKLAFGNEKDTVRFFIWWKDISKGKVDDYYDSGRVDLDLSAVGYDANWNHKGHIAYYNLRENFAVHSGDITSAPKGASEFIDLDIPRAIKSGLRYVVMTVHGYTEQNFSDLPECFAGFMLREKAQSGEVYDPRTIVDRADLTSGNRDCVPLIIDLVERKVIWCDAAMSAEPRNSYGYGRQHNVASTRGGIELLGKAFTSIKKPTLFDLLSLHAEARGTLVTDEKKADVVFSVKAGTPFELDRIASEFMADAEKTKAATV
jgi:stress response protein SCP2